MQKWEYLFVSCEFEKEQWRPKYVNGQELKNWHDINLYDYSNKLGDEGWEMVNTTSHGAGNFTYIFRVVFKKPR